MPGMGEMAGMEGTTSVTASSPFSTPTSLTSLTLGAANSVETAASSSPAQMGPMLSMSGMSNAFHFGVGDTLWITSLTPANSQGYAGAIALLILMALFLRLLTILRDMAEKRWDPKKPARCFHDEADDYLKMGQSREDDGEVAPASRWNATIQFTRALFQLTTITIGYLLMLAVMTFNLGYLLAILAGAFLGELALSWIKY